MTLRPASLRSVMTIMFATVGVIATAVGVWVALVNSLLEHTRGTVLTSMATTHMAEETQADLIAASTAEDRRGVEEVIEVKLMRLRQTVDTQTERDLLRDVEEKIGAFFAAQDRAKAGDAAAWPEAALHAALHALDKLSHGDIFQAEAALRRGGRWHEAMAVAGIALAVTVLVGTASLVWWIRRSTLQPLLEISQAMSRFGAGKTSVRANERGVSELRSIARQFNVMAESLERQRQAQAALLGGVAHDLKNPLSAMRLSIAAVAPDRPLPAEPQLRSLLSLVERQVERLERMATDFLDGARIEAGQLELRLEECDAREVARECIHLFQDVSAAHELVLSAPEKPVRLRCDATRLLQVLSNLVSNAIKYSPHGGRVEIVVGETEEGVRLRVTDQGIGISAEDQERLFEPFQRRGASREVIPGVGLGLYVSRRIVEAHGGRISVSSAPGAGSVFEVVLPRSRP
ncbi:MAG: HAMP domain-containing histidine kinase [Planctomycetes bacterium]|nr:HAMP domain-containing histidine kinase [Planctomycetota bacterium]